MLKWVSETKCYTRLDSTDAELGAHSTDYEEQDCLFVLSSGLQS
jgi:hypothetical protein